MNALVVLSITIIAYGAVLGSLWGVFFLSMLWKWHVIIQCASFAVAAVVTAVLIVLVNFVHGTGPNP